MNEQKRRMSNLVDFYLFFTGISGKRINWVKVEEEYGEETARRLQQEIEVCKVRT